MAAEDEKGRTTIEILLIEPNPGDERLFAETFEDAEIANIAHTVSNGDETLNFLQQQDGHANNSSPDLILLEPRLPGKSGLEVLSELNDDPVLCEIPVVVLTTSDFGEDIIKENDINTDHHIRKPDEPDDFARFIQDIEKFWLSINKQEAT
ncbi:response regulator [Natrinema sp. CBA1119]|uniref:response regulator n=1 Tax=Natrinema sp. CBA1119 TaxID=1608465 RepID=UPI000BF2B9D8|nr:response regulator [Natrinema sp. CBA1119]PGF14642.1 response regulator [Natrinema sp. CBA1119]